MASRRRKIAFGSVMMASSAMNNLFVTFYLDLFIHHSQLNSSNFLSGQTLYLIWNALNDPLFGFLQDSGGKSKSDALRTRIRAIRLGGIAWALAFLMVWFPPPPGTFFLSTLHFVLSICLYDGFLTLVEISHSALLSEITVDDAERAEFNSYSATLAGIGSFSSFVGQITWDRETLSLFRVTMAVIALVSAGIFVWSAKVLKGPSQKHSPKHVPYTQTSEKEKSPSKLSFFILNVGSFCRELASHRNFWVFVIVSCVQSFDCAFEKSSFSILLERLTESSVSTYSRGLVISASFFLPWLLTLFLTEPIKQFGVYQVLLCVFATRCLFCFVGFIHSSSSDSAVPFLLLNRVSSELVCRISPLVLSDLVDEDRFLNKRHSEETRSGSIVGSQHFFAKIASSIGPMVSFAVVQSTLPTHVLRMLFATIPSVCVTIQITLWVFVFGLKGRYLARVRAYVEDKNGDGRSLQEAV